MRHLAATQNFHPSTALYYLFPSPRHWRTHLHFPPSSFLPTPSLPVGMQKPSGRKNERQRERGRETRKTDGRRNILLKTKRREWNRYAAIYIYIYTYVYTIFPFFRLFFFLLSSFFLSSFFCFASREEYFCLPLFLGSPFRLLSVFLRYAPQAFL